MRNTRLWQRVLGLARTVIEGVEFDEDDDAVVVSVRPRKGRAATMWTLWSQSALV